jgi:hypothetical protein
MSQVTIVNRSRMFAAATAITAMGFLAVPAPAQAHPMLPLAPPCSQWGFDGYFALTQSNNYVVEFRSFGPDADGQASATGQTPLSGHVVGSIKGNNVDFTIGWYDTHKRGHYTGVVGSDGFAHGDGVDELNPGSTAHWDSTVPLKCIS